jgi:ABC-2 type transport system ATP-binding protein
MKQRLSLAVALMHKPGILFLDEPTNGVDIVARKQLWDVVRRISSEGTAVLISTQYLEEGEYCNTVGLMKTGKLIAADSPTRLKAEIPGAIWEVRAGGADRFAISHDLEHTHGVSHVRRLGTAVRFLAAENTDLGSFNAVRSKPNLHDAYVWYSNEEAECVD